MPLSPEQEKALRDTAEAEGIDADELIAVAEELDSEQQKKPRADDEGKSDGSKAAKAAPAAEAKVKPNLYMYLLPFVTVNEVRTIWLELDPIEGGEMNAAKYAALQTAGAPASAADDADGGAPT